MSLFPATKSKGFAPTASEHRNPARRLFDARLLLSLISICALFFFYLPHRSFLKADAPYEGWDEVTIYNNAGSLMHQREPDKAYAVYGMLDTAKYVLARWIHEGRAGKPSPVFSNNREESWAQPAKDASVFGYARGIDDRTGFLIAREINLAFVYLLAGFTLVSSIWLFGTCALGFAACLLLALSSSGVLSQSNFALPNGPNAILAFSVLFFSLTAVLKNKIRWLALASAFLAMGINHKFDFLIQGNTTAVAALYFVIRDIRQPIKILKTVLILALVFLATLLLTCPIGPISELKNQISMVSSLTNATPNLADNFAKARDSMLLMFSPDSTDWQPAPTAATILISLLLILALGWPFMARTLSLGQRLTAFVLILLGLFVSLAVPILQATVFYGRYLISGSTLLFAGTGLGLIVLAQANNRRPIRIVAWSLSVLFLAFVGLRLNYVWRTQGNFIGRLNAVTGLDDTHTRNRAVAEAIYKAGKNAISRKVLIDQHAYIDLAALKEKGLEPVPINFSNFRDQISRLPVGNYLLIYTTGEYLSQQEWEGAWSETYRRQYDSYLEFLKSMPIERDFPGNKMPLLSWRPPLAGDWITLAQVRRPSHP